MKTKKREIDLEVKGYKGLEAFHKYWGKKPVESWNILINELSKRGDVLLDPFLGSGLVARESVDKGRSFIGIDINPISIELTKFFLNPPKPEKLILEFSKLEASMKPYLDETYTWNGDLVTHLLWENEKITEYWVKNKNKKIVHKADKKFSLNFNNPKKYKIKNFREPIFFNNARINTKHEMGIHDIFTDRALEFIDRLLFEISKIKNPDVKRAMKLLLSSSAGQMSNMVFAVTSRGKTSGRISTRTEVGSWAIGYWRPETHFEVNPWNCFVNKKDKMLKGLLEAEKNNFLDRGQSTLHLGDSEKKLKLIESASVQLILTDPPHGDRIPYLELSEMWNSLLSYKSDFKNELVVSNAKERKLNDATYTSKFNRIIEECLRVLKPEGFLAIMFNSRTEEHWDALTSLNSDKDLSLVGCYSMNYSAGSIVQDNRKGGLKNDYVLVFAKKLNSNKLKTLRNRLRVLPNWSDSLPEVKRAS